ncbi:hypothetical protein [Nocardioides sp. 1609]|uniref:hypothetical protein n=1 Tax=Nocardioides sp. 1609 TaxID=2508327 RepID=UPI0010706528|nr:hypothetical protein [Nocardioides sp. 1609]
MSEMGRHLDTLVVSATTPDETASATLHGRTRVTVSLASGYYAYTTDDRLADKLAQLGRLLWVARMQEYYRFKSEQLGRQVRGEGAPRTPAQSERREARDNIVARGVSHDGAVGLAAVGLFTWTASVAPGTARRSSEEEFCSAAGQAAEQLIEDHLWNLALVWANGAR